MFSSRIRPESSTWFQLTLWNLLVFSGCILLILTLGYYAVDTAFQSGDRRELSERLEKYHDIHAMGGYSSLLIRLWADADPIRKNGMFLLLTDQAGNHSFHLNPVQVSEVDLSHLPAVPRPGTWYTIGCTVPFHGEDENDEIIETTGISLSDGVLWIGIWADQREERLEQIRNTLLKLLIPALFLGTGACALLAWRTLKPLRDLALTLQTVSTGDMGARVSIRGNHSEIDTLSHLFNRMLERIETLITAMGESLDHVSHDLRTPLTRMRIGIERAIGQEEDPAILREALLDCAEETDRIERMLRILLDISEAETGTMQLSIQSTSLAELLAHITILYEFPMEEKALRLTTTVPEDFHILVDRDRFCQVFANLMDNAVKFSPRNREIRITAMETSAYSEIGVLDSGPGIPENDLPRIFDRLYRSDQSRHSYGMGLGLAMVRAVIQAHQGTIRAENRPEGGAAFWIRLPRSL